MGTPLGAPLRDPQMIPVPYDMPTQYALPLETQWPPLRPSYEQPLDMQFVSPELQPTHFRQNNVADLGLKPLQLKQMVCAQAMSGQWWTAEVFHDNMDYTYFLLVQDDVQTRWPRVHWADIIDKSCSDFYQAELDREDGQQQQQIQPEQHQELNHAMYQELQIQDQDLPLQELQFHQDPNQELQIQDQDLPLQELPQEQDKNGRWFAGERKRPLGVISVAALAASVPVLYHLT